MTFERNPRKNRETERRQTEILDMIFLGKNERKIRTIDEKPKKKTPALIVVACFFFKHTERFRRYKKIGWVGSGGNSESTSKEQPNQVAVYDLSIL